ARNSVLHARQGEQRQANAGEIQRHDLVPAYHITGERDRESGHPGQAGGDRHRQPAAGEQKAAEQLLSLATGIFRNETLRGGRQCTTAQRTRPAALESSGASAVRPFKARRHSALSISASPPRWLEREFRSDGQGTGGWTAININSTPGRTAGCGEPPPE